MQGLHSRGLMAQRHDMQAAAMYMSAWEEKKRTMLLTLPKKPDRMTQNEVYDTCSSSAVQVAHLAAVTICRGHPAAGHASCS